MANRAALSHIMWVHWYFLIRRCPNGQPNDNRGLAVISVQISTVMATLKFTVQGAKNLPRIHSTFSGCYSCFRLAILNLQRTLELELE